MLAAYIYSLTKMAEASSCRRNMLVQTWKSCTFLLNSGPAPGRQALRTSESLSRPRSRFATRSIRATMVKLGEKYNGLLLELFVLLQASVQLQHSWLFHCMGSSIPRASVWSNTRRNCKAPPCLKLSSESGFGGLPLLSKNPSGKQSYEKSNSSGCTY